jgi:hypothetical protein
MVLHVVTLILKLYNHNILVAILQFWRPPGSPLSNLILDQLHLVPLGGDTGPRRTSPALRFSHYHPGLAHPSEKKYDGDSFLRPAIDSYTANSALIVSVSAKTSQFICHTIEN